MQPRLIHRRQREPRTYQVNLKLTRSEYQKMLAMMLYEHHISIASLVRKVILRLFDDMDTMSHANDLQTAILWESALEAAEKGMDELDGRIP
jgi:hypothetical protein